MIVYGDQVRLAAAPDILDEIAEAMEHGAYISALIAAGQLQQGLEDAEMARRGADGLGEVSQASGALTLALARLSGGLGDPAEFHHPLQALRACACPAPLSLKQPEGFALYAVDPLAYFRAARALRGRVGAVVAPADGKVISVRAVAPPPELGIGIAPRWRVGIFLSLVNVHVNRIPADGTVTRIAYRHGRFMAANSDRSSENNERNAIAIRLPDGREIAVVQIAGLLARRILCAVREGDRVEAGMRFGMIRFGSRTDLYLPEGVRPLVSEGQTMIGGETVVAQLTARLAG